MNELQHKSVERQETAELIMNAIHKLLIENNFSLAIHKQYQKIVLVDHEINNWLDISIDEF